jgi:hypothetical protein
MRIAVVALFSLLCLSTVAGADPFTVTTTLTTSGVFRCRPPLVCSGEGTNSITMTNGDEVGTLTFTGVNSTFEVSSSLMRRQVALGEFELTATDGFTIPGNNPNRWAFAFDMSLSQTGPVPGEDSGRFLFGIATRPYAQVLFRPSYFSFPVGPNPFKLVHDAECESRDRAGAGHDGASWNGPRRSRDGPTPPAIGRRMMRSVR